MAGKEGAQGRARAHLHLAGVKVQVTESLCFTKGTVSATEGKWSSVGKDLLPCQPSPPRPATGRQAPPQVTGLGPSGLSPALFPQQNSRPKGWCS